jgi:hypothetical protein
MPEKVNGNKFNGKSNIASLNSNHSPLDSKSTVQLNSKEQKLATIQKMADNSPYSQRFAHLTSLANNSTPKQPVSQLSKDSHSLPDNVKQGVESLSGISMDDVKVHYNSAKPAQLNAHAYAQGTDIHLASGQEKHLPHEAWHVVQQKQGRVRPTTMMKAKVPINDDAGLEKEADVMGARALQGKFVLPRTEKRIGIAFSSKQPTQLVGVDKPEDNLEKEFLVQQSWSPFGEQAVPDKKNPLHATMYADKLPEGSSNNELKRYVAFLKLFLDEIMSIDFTNAKNAKENNDYLRKLEILHTTLNVIGVTAGITSLFALGAISGGLGPIAVAAGAIASNWAVGASVSAVGLGLNLEKSRAKENFKAKEISADVSKEGGINIASNLGGFIVGQAVGIFQLLGLKNNRDNFLKLDVGKKAIIAEFNSIGVTLLEVKSQLQNLEFRDSSVDELLKTILPDIDKSTEKITKITGTFPELPPLPSGDVTL